MQVRNHPLMVYTGRPSWPPQWQWISGSKTVESAAGEAGTPKRVQKARVLGNTIFITIETASGDRFTGQLKFDNEIFAETILLLLQKHVGQTIKNIAQIEIPSIVRSGSFPDDVLGAP